MTMSVSTTTRPPRVGEVDGEDYWFVDEDSFKRRVAEGVFLEHAKVFGHFYGTLKGPVEEALKAGIDVLFDIDWQGTQQIAQQMPEALVSIFILPPSTEELARRLKSRGQDSEGVIAQRMAKAQSEISHWAEYNYVIVNDDVECALHTIKGILYAERLKRERQTGLVPFVQTLLDDRNGVGL